MKRYLRKLNSLYNCHKYRNSELKKSHNVKSTKLAEILKSMRKKSLHDCLFKI